ncbi:MAG TPA: lipopolysaccharide heptosyltransferase I [Sulfuricurvum sp.]|nr:lipopolysaccharide heptosyltransferase I [Sulfuricurvum sp.]
MNRSPSRIAIVRLSALGDIVNTAVVLQIIHRHYPQARVDWFVEEAFASVLEAHPLIHEVVPVPLKRIKKQKSFSLLYQTIRLLRSRESYDCIIDAQGLLKSAIVASCLKGPVHGFDRNSAREGVASLFYKTTSKIAYDLNIIKRNVMVITEALAIPYQEKEILHKEPVFPMGPKPDLFPENTKAIACVIGASWPSKCYPKQQFAELCNLLPYPCYLIWGSKSEYQVAQWIAERAKNAIIAPKMSLSELVHFIGHCDLTIGNDTGPTHMAWAMNRPSITLFGPTTERMIYATAINLGIKSPSDVDIFKINRNDFSIGQIDPYYIADKAKELL